MRYVEERPHRRWPRAAVTHRAQGGCGLIQRQNSPPMLSHRNHHPSLAEPRKTPVRDPLYFFNSLLRGGHRGKELVDQLICVDPPCVRFVGRA